MADKNVRPTVLLGLPNRNRRRGFTLIELLVAMGILSILGWALVQLLSSGMTTWRSGEMRRGAYERAQFIFDRITRDVATLYPHNPPMPEAWTFQVDSLFDPAYTAADDDAVAFASDNMSLAEGLFVVGHIIYYTSRLEVADASQPAWIEYKFELPFEVETAVVQPRITLLESGDGEPTCDVIVEAAKDGGAFARAWSFESGARAMTVTRSVDISGAVSGAKNVTVRIRVEPVAGRTANVKLLEAGMNDPMPPVFRFAASPKQCETRIELVSDYGPPQNRQQLDFVRSQRGLEQILYYVSDETLFRAQRPFGSDDTENVTPLAKGVVYFGCEFQNQYVRGGDPDEEAERQAAALQRYWVEADSVPPYITVIVSTIPLSGARRLAHLSADIPKDAGVIEVESTKPFVVGNPGQQVVKIDDEWIEYEGLEPRRFTGCVRGVRGTRASAHKKGAQVMGAETFRVNIPIPAWGYRQR